MTTTNRTRRLPLPSDRIHLGDGLRVSPLCVGAVGAPDVVEAAFDAGINFFFLTADMHWPFYEALRVGLGSLLARRPEVRDAITVAVVSYVTQREFCHAPFHEVIAAVPGLERIDVSVIGGSYRSDFGPRREEYARHREGGIPGVRATGASFHERLAAARAVREREVDLAFVRYNTVHRGAEADILDDLPAAAPPVFVFKSTFGFVPKDDLVALGLTDEHWVPTPDDHYRYVLGTPGVAGLLCAPRSTAHLQRALEALEEGPLDDDERAYMNDLGDVVGGRAAVGAD